MSRTWQPPSLAQFSHVGGTFDVDGRPLVEEDVRWTPCHRIIASEYAGENLFDRIASEADYLKAQQEAETLREIADLTNRYVQTEAGRLDLIRPEDRIYGDGAPLIMAAFAYPGGSSRFSDGSVGTYYATKDAETAIAETRYHDEIALVGSGPCVIEKTEVQAILDGTLVDLRPGNPFPKDMYNPFSYGVGQAFGAFVRSLGGYGVVYSSVRNPVAGECAAIFRPPVLSNAVAVRTLQYHWDGARIVDVR